MHDSHDQDTPEEGDTETLLARIAARYIADLIAVIEATPEGEQRRPGVLTLKAYVAVVHALHVVAQSVVELYPGEPSEGDAGDPSE